MKIAPATVILVICMILFNAFRRRKEGGGFWKTFFATVFFGGGVLTYIAAIIFSWVLKFILIVGGFIGLAAIF